MTIGQRFNTDEQSAISAEDYAKELVLREDKDSFILLVPKVDVDISNGFTYEQANYYVTTCVDPRMIGVVLGAFSYTFNETDQMWQFVYQDLQPNEGNNGNERDN